MTPGEMTMVEHYPSGNKAMREVLHKLAAYEDTGLTPEEVAELARMKEKDEYLGYRFYYCESEDSYLLGHRVGTFYYAHWRGKMGFVWDMSRYLPWGETVHSTNTAWKVASYPSEPIEIGASEWFLGFLSQRSAAEAALAERKKGSK